MAKKQNIIFRNRIKENFFNKKKNIKTKSKLIKIIKKTLLEIENKNTTLSSLNKNFEYLPEINKLKKFKKFKTIVIFGMGGSILGAKSIYSFIKKTKKSMIFFDNLDLNIFDKIKKKNNLKSILFIMISKSGNTLETLTNINLYKKNIFNKNNTIVITQNTKNPLNSFAKKFKILNIEHRKYIGGRYSVLTEVGMIPAYLMNCDIRKFRKNLLSHFKNKKKTFLQDSILKLNQIYSSKKFNSIIFFNYSPRLNDFLYWCQQLIAESLGKKGKGLLPVISPAPKDHHSLLQLYLDGPKDKIFYVFSSTENSLNKKINNIVAAQKKAFIKVLEKKNIPYREFIVNKFDEQTLGELFSYFILETALLGNTLNVDPYTQPAVEKVKLWTKKYLLNKKIQTVF